MEDEEEEDYMSDTFLLNEANPGLVPELFLKKQNYKDKKLHNHTIKKFNEKPVKVQEVERRNEKLDTALDESNKGFAMLSKMGFKKGMGLGKEGQGRSDPIPLEIKAGRKGLGKETADNQRKQKRREAYEFIAKRKKVIEENLKGDFKNRMKEKLSERQIIQDLRKSQKACEQLDSTRGVETPQKLWYWPAPYNPDDEGEGKNEADAEENNTDEKLCILTNYLRKNHLYCIWCGTAFDDEKDLMNSCPGDTFSAHDE